MNRNIQFSDVEPAQIKSVIGHGVSHLDIAGNLEMNVPTINRFMVKKKKNAVMIPE